MNVGGKEKGDSEVSDLLRSFFAISPQRILLDLRNIESQADEHRKEEARVRRLGCDRLSDLAESYHRRLLLGHNMLQVSMLPPDLVLFAATVTAHEIAELSCANSCGRGRSLELCQILENLEGSSRLDEFSNAVFASDVMIAKIHDAVFLEILVRYGMDQVASLFEDNRPLYEIRCAVGRQLIVGELDQEEEHEKTIESFRELYGPEFLQEYLRRLTSHDLLEG